MQRDTYMSCIGINQEYIENAFIANKAGKLTEPLIFIFRAIMPLQYMKNSVHMSIAVEIIECDKFGGKLELLFECA